MLFVSRRLGPILVTMLVTLGGWASVAHAAATSSRDGAQTCIKVVVEDVTIPIDDSGCDQP